MSRQNLLFNENEEMKELPKLLNSVGFSLEDDQYGIVKAIASWLRENPNHRQPFIRLSGYAGCIDEDSVILTTEGSKTLREIILMQRKDLSFLGFFKFEKDLSVISHDGTINRITDIFATPENTSGFLIETDCGYTLKCSWKHPLLNVDIASNNVRWKRATDIEVGDYVKMSHDGVNFYNSRIKQVLPITQKFYDLTVSSKESFISNNFVSHNTGKSVIISYILENEHLILPKYMQTKNIAVVTYTWKAALVLKERGVKNASSIHSIFYKPSSEENSTFIRRSPEELRSEYSMIIVDEASMVSNTIREDLEAAKIPILYVGDNNQLPPIQKINGEDDLFMANSELNLIKIRRQALDSPIIRMATDIREGKRVPYGKYGDGVFKVTADQITDNILLGSDQLICGFNKTREVLNRRVRRLLGHNVKLSPNIGEKIIGLGNIPEAGVYNGQQWLLNDTNKNISLEHCSDYVFTLNNGLNTVKMQLAFPDDLILKNFKTLQQAYHALREDGIYPVDFGYAITCHKSQGSSYDKAVIFEEAFGDKVYKRKWLYTAVTRAKEKVIVVSN